MMALGSLECSKTQAHDPTRAPPPGTSHYLQTEERGVKDVCPPAIKMFDIAAMKPVSQAALNYLEEWYDFTDNNYQKNVASLALKSKFTFSHLCDAVEAYR
ncbi:hypothetical protein F7725_016333 [Dissostichus mawsoni]|uniref:Uncharacterized protein n=1 Tax=Dissostichus mawsoni TaxID=36200 RepID=A0A7J5Z1R0_DISMA|nr:hypothetical protein F7725_016333 [Dissostichus mawsoni]